MVRLRDRESFVVVGCLMGACGPRGAGGFGMAHVSPGALRFAAVIAACCVKRSSASLMARRAFLEMKGPYVGSR